MMEGLDIFIEVRDCLKALKILNPKDNMQNSLKEKFLIKLYSIHS
jgi:hypothetical protein